MTPQAGVGYGGDEPRVEQASTIINATPHTFYEHHLVDNHNETKRWTASGHHHVQVRAMPT